MKTLSMTQKMDAYLMENEIEIKELLKIRKAIMTSPAVTDTLWLENENSTVVESIDWLLIKLGMSQEAVEALGEF